MGADGGIVDPGPVCGKTDLQHLAAVLREDRDVIALFQPCCPQDPRALVRAFFKHTEGDGFAGGSHDKGRLVRRVIAGLIRDVNLGHIRTR